MIDGDKEEREHWNNVMRTFLHYEEFIIFDLERKQTRYNKLSNHFIDRLPQITFDKFSRIHKAAQCNQKFFEDMVYYHASCGAYVPPNDDCASSAGDNDNYSYVMVPMKDKGPIIRIDQQHRNQAVLHSIYREFSYEGLSERQHTFTLLIEQLQAYLPITNHQMLYRRRVLVPGCGIGRLPLEIAALGYACEGNEFSAFMAIASNFILNGITKREAYTIYPWISNVSNVVHVDDVIQSITVPDQCASDLLSAVFDTIHPTTTVNYGNNTSNNNETTVVVAMSDSVDISKGNDVDISKGSCSNGHDNVSGDGIDNAQLSYPRFSMAAGDFVEIYGVNSNTTDDPSKHVDAVVTCFFLDTAPVVLDYIETIHHVLKPGGLWINLGPLLYHWEKDQDFGNNDPRYNQSIEVSVDDGDVHRMVNLIVTTMMFMTIDIDYDVIYLSLLHICS